MSIYKKRDTHFCLENVSDDLLLNEESENKHKYGLKLIRNL